MKSIHEENREFPALSAESNEPLRYYLGCQRLFLRGFRLRSPVDADATRVTKTGYSAAYYRNNFTIPSPPADRCGAYFSGPTNLGDRS